MLKLIIWKLLSFSFFLVVASGARAHTHHQRALLIGGGHRPLTALQHLKSWSVGKPNADAVLVVTWASKSPGDTFDAIVPELQAAGYTSVEEAVRADAPNARQKFLTQLSQATTVFFTGGDQVKFMKSAQTLGVTVDLQSAYQSGVAFAGTSAGTAVMSRDMFSGAESLTTIKKSMVPEVMEVGLGFFNSILIDQHFVVRMRWARLFNALLSRPDRRGLGVDEDTAVSLETALNGELHARVFGEGTVVLLNSEASSLKMKFYQDGEKFTVPLAPSSKPR